MEIQHDDRGYEPCRKCLHYSHGYVSKGKYGTLFYRPIPRCALKLDLYPKSCPEFTEMRPERRSYDFLV